MCARLPGILGLPRAQRLPRQDRAGLGAPLIAAIVWGAFVSSKAAIPLSAPLWILGQAGVFGAVMAALAAGRPGLAWALGLIAIVNGVLMYLLGS
jgi:hypothetical protein